MGTFRVDIEIENPLEPGERRLIHSVFVDTGAELSWFPAELLDKLGIERYAPLTNGRSRSRRTRADSNARRASSIVGIGSPGYRELG